MRIALDLTALMPEPTGVDRSMTQLVVHLAKIDRENHYRIFLNREDRDVFAGMLPGNFRTHTLSLRPRPIRGVFQQIILPLAAQRWDADVVHSPAFIMPMYRGRERHVLTIHDLTSFSLPQHHIPLRRSALYKAAVRASIGRANLVIAPSHATKRSILSLAPMMPPDRVRVISWGIGREFRMYPAAEIQQASMRLGLPPRYILFVGTIEPRKNLQLLIETYQTLISKEQISEHLVLVGRLGWGYESLLERLGAPELSGRVHLRGYVSETDLLWIYAAARLFVYPSLEEGFGFPPLEAMACGVPTVATASSSLAENLEGAAELVPPSDAEALAAAIFHMLTDEECRQQRRERGIRRAAQFDWTRTACQTLECYYSASSERRNCAAE